MASALKATGRQISRDVIELYCTTGGMVDQAIDNHFWSLWTLERVVTESAKYPGPYLPFADCLIDSHFYCFKYTNVGESSVCINWLNGGGPQQVAESVNRFFEVYAAAPERLELHRL